MFVYLNHSQRIINIADIVEARPSFGGGGAVVSLELDRRYRMGDVLYGQDAEDVWWLLRQVCQGVPGQLENGAPK